MNRRLSCKDSVGTLKDEPNVIMTDNSDKVELNYFGSVTADDGKLPKVDYSLSNGNVIDSVTFNLSTVQKVIKKLKSTKRKPSKHLGSTTSKTPERIL